MKYLAILDYEHTEIMDLAKKAQAYEVEKKLHPDKYPEVPFDAHVMVKGKKGVAIWEATPEQVTRKVAFMIPEVVYTLVPIRDGKEFLKTYREVKE